MIEVVTLVITRERIVISAIGEKTAIKEEYKRTRRATIKRVSGDFDTAGIEGPAGELSDLADLLHDFIALGSTAREIQEQLNQA